MKPIIVIVGRPNVGKSTLFNQLVGRRRSIVHDQPGVTRDRVTSIVEILGREAWIVDTGGFKGEPSGAIDGLVVDQVRQAVEDANIVVGVFDARVGLHPDDKSIVEFVRKSGKQILPVVNKMDPGARTLSSNEFFALGLGNPIEISAEHKLGIDTLREGILKGLPESESSETEIEDPESTRVAILGRPNVGKSSLLNCLLQEERVAVDDQPGTTRDLIDTSISHRKHTFHFMDTAGLRKKSHVTQRLEQISVTRSLHALERCDVAALLIDASEPISTQDLKIASWIIEAHKGLILLANKWDLREDHELERRDFRQEVVDRAPFLKFAGVRFISAKENLGVDGVWPFIRRVHKNIKKKYETQFLSDIFKKILSSGELPGGDNQGGGFLRLHQNPDRNACFIVRCSDPRQVREDLKRYWVNRLTEALELEGVPVEVWFRRKAKGRK